MSTSLLVGCDVSKYQTPSMVNWSSLDFGIARATYGKWADPSAEYHASQIRAGKAVPGLYAFFRGDQDATEQADTFFKVSQLVRLVPGDLIPWTDVEDFPGHQISATDMAGLENFVDQVDSLLSCSCGIYITQRDWHRLGKPGWILDRPLWVAHYPINGARQRLAKPATPNGMPWRIWQCMVGPLGQTLQDTRHPRAIDHDVAIAPLPLLRRSDPSAAPFEAPNDSNVPWLGLHDSDWEEMVASRDHSIIEDEEVIA